MNVYASFVTLALLPLLGCTGEVPTFEPVVLEPGGAFKGDVSALQAQLEPLPPGDRILAAMTISDTRCDKFFEDLEKLQTESKWAANRLTSASTALPALLQAASASSLAVAAVPAALGFAESAITDYSDLFLLSKFSGDVFLKWQAAKDQAEAAVYQILTNPGPIPLSSARIDREIYKYSKLCLRSQLTAWLEQSASGGEVVSSSETTATGAVRSATRLGPRRVLVTIPSYVVRTQ